jgi:hypothetical protein
MTVGLPPPGATNDPSTGFPPLAGIEGPVYFFAIEDTLFAVGADSRIAEEAIRRIGAGG